MNKLLKHAEDIEIRNEQLFAHSKWAKKAIDEATPEEKAEFIKRRVK